MGRRGHIVRLDGTTYAIARRRVAVDKTDLADDLRSDAEKEGQTWGESSAQVGMFYSSVFIDNETTDSKRMTGDSSPVSLVSVATARTQKVESSCIY